MGWQRHMDGGWSASPEDGRQGLLWKEKRHCIAWVVGQLHRGAPSSLQRGRAKQGQARQQERLQGQDDQTGEQALKD
ncbi:hypothetical protein GOP47_0008027 [Adiantum capillus-veneris]|uniref:Uncharacterized protein n=1 Tax=Adiantum capillus-veneris TaxID=13818 RepID=A0A9D4UY88_ADICA|nr:hypothetical protein GOP47_0008027 [Adiantum capillus-veneris]